MTRYIALIHKDADSDYGVSFPNLPGCITAGKTYDEAIHMAVEALAAHMDFLKRSGEAIPAPSDLEAAKAATDPDVWETALVTLVPVVSSGSRALRLNITLESDLVDEIDEAAKRSGMSRSAFLARAARIAIASAA